jgi:hypothetical protein
MPEVGQVRGHADVPLRPSGSKDERECLNVLGEAHFPGANLVARTYSSHLA